MNLHQKISGLCVWKRWPPVVTGYESVKIGWLRLILYEKVWRHKWTVPDQVLKSVSRRGDTEQLHLSDKFSEHCWKPLLNYKFYWKPLYKHFLIFNIVDKTKQKITFSIFFPSKICCSFMWLLWARLSAITITEW